MAQETIWRVLQRRLLHTPKHIQGGRIRSEYLRCRRYGIMLHRQFIVPATQCFNMYYHCRSCYTMSTFGLVKIRLRTNTEQLRTRLLNWIPWSVGLHRCSLFSFPYALPLPYLPHFLSSLSIYFLFKLYVVLSFSVSYVQFVYIA